MPKQITAAEVIDTEHDVTVNSANKDTDTNYFAMLPAEMVQKIVNYLSINDAVHLLRASVFFAPYLQAVSYLSTHPREFTETAIALKQKSKYDWYQYWPESIKPFNLPRTAEFFKCLVQTGYYKNLCKTSGSTLLLQNLLDRGAIEVHAEILWLDVYSLANAVDCLISENEHGSFKSWEDFKALPFGERDAYVQTVSRILGAQLCALLFTEHKISGISFSDACNIPGNPNVAKRYLEEFLTRNVFSEQIKHLIVAQPFYAAVNTLQKEPDYPKNISKISIVEKFEGHFIYRHSPDAHRDEINLFKARNHLQQDRKSHWAKLRTELQLNPSAQTPSSTLTAYQNVQQHSKQQTTDNNGGQTAQTEHPVPPFAQGPRSTWW